MTPAGAARRLTCHVLDLTTGRPAAGMDVRLTRLDGPDPGLRMATTTNTDGRTDEPLLVGAALQTGRYELTFALGAHFAIASEPPPYLDVVPVQFGVADDVGHLHVAMLVTPWSYTTYRGS